MEELTSLFLDYNTNIEEIFNFIDNIVVKYNIDEKNLIKDYLNYIIRNEVQYVTNELLKTMEFIIHISSNNNKYIITYFVYRLHEILSK